MNKIITFIKKEKIQLLLLCIILGIGLYLRVGGVIANSFAFTYDVGRDMLQVQQIVAGDKLPLIGQTTGLGGLYYGPWWYYILTPAFLITGGNPQGVAFFMVLVGLFTIIAGYIYGLRTANKWLGIIIATLLSFSSVLVGLSNQIWNPNIAPLLLIMLLLVVQGKYKKNLHEFFINILMGLLIGLILDSEIVFGVLVAASVFLILLYLKRKKMFMPQTLGIIGGIFITLAPRVLFEARHDFVMTRSLFMQRSADQQVFDPGNFFTVIPERLITFLVQFSETFGMPVILGFLTIVFLAFTFIFFKKRIKKQERHVLISCLIIMGVFIVGSSVFARAIWGHYLVGLPVVYVIIASLGVLILARKNAISGVLAFIILATFSIRPMGVLSSIQNPNWEGNAAVYRNQIAVIDYIYANSNGKKFNYTAYTPVVYDYTYQYLFSWYGNTKYHYEPQKTAQNKLYVILEPDPDYPGRIDDWLKIREGDGKVVGEKVIKGGIKVQTRVR